MTGDWQARPLVKVCGITRADDALLAVEHGATAVGFVFWGTSPRCVSPQAASAIGRMLPPGIMRVGVFVNEPVEGVDRVAARAGLDLIQLHGDEPPGYAARLALPILRSVTLDTVAAVCEVWPGETTLLLDAADRERRGGTGRTVDWDRAALVARARRTVLAGGLTPENVAEAVATVRPHGVDVSSGVERSPGIKDATKVMTFLANAREALERCTA